MRPPVLLNQQFNTFDQNQKRREKKLLLLEGRCPPSATGRRCGPANLHVEAPPATTVTVSSCWDRFGFRV